MTLDHSTPSATKGTFSRRIAGVITVISLALYAYWQLKRVEQGHLFALALPWDRPPSTVEIIDARLTAQTYLFPAIVAIAGVVAFLIPRLRLPRSRPSKVEILAGSLFLLSVLADLLTTLHFFHHQGIEYELHPGIRLFGYVYGLTSGPIFGKLLQAIGILAISLVGGRYGIWLLFVVTIIYFLAALHNASQMVA